MWEIPNLSHTVSISQSKIILASASPRRRELLAQLGVIFAVHPSDVNEDPLPNETPLETQQRITRNKAAVAAQNDANADADTGTWIIAADTTVLIDGEMLNKPVDTAEAWAMLRRLRGRVHQVQTCLVVRQADTEAIHIVKSQVLMRHYSDAEIEAYIASGDPFDKAGSYAVQHLNFSPVAQISGCPLNVIGLPLCKLRQFQQQPFSCGVGNVLCVDHECAKTFRTAATSNDYCPK